MVASNLLFRQFQFRNPVMAVNHRRGLPATVVVDPASNKDHQDTVDSSPLFRLRNQAEVMAVNHHRVLPAMAVHSLNLFRFLPVVEVTVVADQANNKDQDHMEASSPPFQFRNQVEVMADNHPRGLLVMVVPLRLLPAERATVEAGQANKDQDMEASSPLYRQFQFRNQMEAVTADSRRFHDLQALPVTVEADPASNNRDLQDMVASQLLQSKGQQRLNQEVVTADHNLVQLDTLAVQDRASKGTAMAQHLNNTDKVQVAITAVANSRRQSNAQVFHPAADHISKDLLQHKVQEIMAARPHGLNLVAGTMGHQLDQFSGLVLPVKEDMEVQHPAQLHQVHPDIEDHRLRLSFPLHLQLTLPAEVTDHPANNSNNSKDMGVHLAQLQLHPEVVDTVAEISNLLDHPALEGMDHLTSNSKDRQDMAANNSKGRRLHQITGAPVHQHLVLPVVEATDRLSLAHQFQLLPAVGATVDQAKDRQDMDNPP
jgi:hypothetical protein